MPIVKVAGGRWVCALGALVVSCGDDGASSVDATSVDAVSAPAHTVFLEFEGRAMTNGPDDPSTDTSGVLPAPYTVPPFMEGDPDRSRVIGEIVDTIEEMLAPYDVAIVTERPVSGEFDMIVFGGTSEAAGFVANAWGVISVFCGESIPSVGFVFDPSGAWPSFPFSTTALGEIGALNGVPFSNVAGDCMCWMGSSCTGDGSPCEIGGAGTLVDDVNWSCEDISTMDEHERWLMAFGAAR
jgi:hypothetical protein